MPKTAIRTLAIILLVPLACQATSILRARHFWEKGSYVGGNIGFIGRGEFRLGDNHYDTDPGFTFGAKFDFRLTGQYFWGVSVDCHRIHVRDTGQYFLETALSLKKMYYSQSSRVAFRPGVGIGFGYLANFHEVNPTSYMTCRTTLEVIFFQETSVAWFLEVGLIGAPVGGNEEVHVTYGPVPLIRIGAIF